MGLNPAVKNHDSIHAGACSIKSDLPGLSARTTTDLEYGSFVDKSKGWLCGGFRSRSPTAVLACDFLEQGRDA